MEELLKCSSFAILFCIFLFGSILKLALWLFSKLGILSVALRVYARCFFSPVGMAVFTHVHFTSGKVMQQLIFSAAALVFAKRIFKPPHLHNIK
jgi:hypothetical protein